MIIFAKTIKRYIISCLSLNFAMQCNARAKGTCCYQSLIIDFLSQALGRKQVYPSDEDRLRSWLGGHSLSQSVSVGRGGWPAATKGHQSQHLKPQSSISNIPTTLHIPLQTTVTHLSRAGYRRPPLPPGWCRHKGAICGRLGRPGEKRALCDGSRRQFTGYHGGPRRPADGVKGGLTSNPGGQWSSACYRHVCRPATSIVVLPKMGSQGADDN